MSLLDRIAIQSLPLVPRPIMRGLASRYIAGETLGEAMGKLRELAGRGFPGMIDLLGEDVEREQEARVVADTYAQVARAIHGAELDAYVSVKPTHVGLLISEELAFELYSHLAATCSELGQFLRVEMEDHTTTDATLRVYERLCETWNNVGIVLQSRLFRTLQDIDELSPRRHHVRMVKGIYLEPETIAHQDPEPIREAYVACCRKLFERDSYVSFATHDDGMAARLIDLCRELGKGKDDYEFQVLLGVQEPLWTRWLSEGHLVRVYVPYGPEWRAYSTRRLRKNPEIFRHVMRDLLGIS